MESKIDDLRDLSHRIEEAFEAGAAGQGRELLERALEASRDIPAYREYFRGGAARYLANDREEQARRIELALDLRPDDYFLMRALGVNLSMSGHDEEALTWFDKALQANPNDYLSMRRKGVSLSRLERYDEALMWFDSALDVNPHDASSMRNLGISLSKCGRNEEAIVWFDRALAENPRDYAAMRQKGVSYSMLGRLDDALAWYDKALEINPTNSAALINKARTLIESHDYLGAVDVYETLIANDRNNPYHYFEKAIALGKLQRTAEAAEAVNQAYELANPTERLRRSKLYWLNRLGIQDEAVGVPAPGRARDAAGGDYGDIARAMEKTWEIFRDDIRSFRKKIEEAKNSFNVFINSSSMFAKNRVFLLGARKWNSFTPSLPLGENDETSVGGGYFLGVNGVGTVIDPGFDFLENFNAMGGRLADIHNIIVTHAHNDHTNDLESILTLFYQRAKNAVKSSSSSVRMGRPRPRPSVNLYMNLGAFQKFSPMINLRATEYIGEVKVIAPHEEYMLTGGLRMWVLPAHHDEIFSRTYAVGLHFTLPTRPAKTLLFSGDTGLFPAGTDITADNVAELEIGSQYGLKPGEVDYFIPHLGSIGDNELKSPDRQDKLGESFYPNHLGVQGLIRLITMLRPKYVFVSEFGEELKGFIVLLMELINRCVLEVNAMNGVPDEEMPVILPMDLYFFCDLTREDIYCARTESFEPLLKTGYRHVDKNNSSQFYYERKDADCTTCDEYFALKKLEYACKINSGPFSDKSNRTHRLVMERENG